MNREQFFQELRTALHREGFVPQPEQDELLPVEWDGLPLCRITADGGVRPELLEYQGFYPLRQLKRRQFSF